MQRLSALGNQYPVVIIYQKNQIYFLLSYDFIKTSYIFAALLSPSFKLRRAKYTFAKASAVTDRLR